MESCSNWLVDNKLSLHLGKTECVLFGPRRKLRNITHFHVQCKDHIIKAQDSVKYLGLFIDNYHQFAGEMESSNTSLQYRIS